MSEELKPCPFCGGEAHFMKVKHVIGIWYAVCCDDEECLGHEQSRLYTLRRLAADAWNRRAERTCRIEVERRKVSQTQTAVVKSCSECGFEFGVEKENTFPFEVTLNVVVPPNYCPNCGARVVKEE